MDDPSRDQQQEGQNIVHLPDGRLAYFPKSVTPQQMQQALSINMPVAPVTQPGPNTFDKPWNSTIDFLRPFISDAAGGAAAVGTALTPYLGEIPGSELAAKNLGYTGMDMLLKKLKTTDQQPSSSGESFLGSEKDAIINSITQGILKSVFRGTKAFYSADQPEIYNFKPTTSQALTSYGMHALATLPKFAEDIGASGAKSKALDRAGGAGLTQAIKFIDAHTGLPYGDLNIDELANKVKSTLEDGIELKNDYQYLPLKPKLEVPEHPGYAPAPTLSKPNPIALPELPPKPVPTPLPDQPNIQSSYAPEYKTEMTNNYNKQVAAIKAQDKQALDAYNEQVTKIKSDNKLQNTQALSDYNEQVAKSKNDYTTYKGAVDATHKQTVDLTKDAFGKQMDQYKANLSQFKDPEYQVNNEAMDILKGGQNPFSKLDDALSDNDKLQKILAAGQANGQVGLNVKKSLQSYQFMKMINDSTSKDLQGNVRLNPDKLTTAWTDPKTASVRDTLWGSEGQDNVTKFLQNIATTQDKQYAVPSILRFANNGFRLAASAVAGISDFGHTAGTIASLYIPVAAMGRAMTNSRVARVLTAMAGSEPLEEGGKKAAHILTDALQGSSIAIEDANGKKTWGTFDKSGQFIENK